jgi:tRNA nucleotidyltransferase/poly(A) polymerase
VSISRTAPLRVVDPATFGDDSLRVLRALQFTARFELTVDEATRRILRGIPLDDLPAERVWGEIEKLLLAPKPSIGFSLAARSRRRRQTLSRAAGARRLRPGARMASGRRRLGSHAAGR